MRVLSPDAVLVEATDRLLGLAQRRGVPLPTLIVPFCPLPALASLVVGMTLPGIGQGFFVPAWIVMAGVFGFRGWRYMRALRQDARAWSPDKAALYRRHALTERTLRSDVRGLVLLLLTMPAMVFAVCLAGPDPLGPWAFNALGYMTLAASAFLLLYVRTAMPHDPDLRDRVSVPQAA